MEASILAGHGKAGRNELNGQQGTPNCGESVCVCAVVERWVVRLVPSLNLFIVEHPLS